VNVDSPYYTRPSYYQVATPISGFYGEGGMNGAASPTAYKAGAPSPFPPDRSLQMTPISGPIYIHPSRVSEFVGNEMPDWRLIPMGGGWGDSILQTVDDSLHDLAMIVGGLASIINDMKMDVVKVPELSRKLSTPELSAKTLQRFSLSNSAKSTINALLLDKDEDWERIQTSFGSTPELIRVAMTLACAAGGVPESRIMGNAPNKGLAKAGGSGGDHFFAAPAAQKNPTASRVSSRNSVVRLQKSQQTGPQKHPIMQKYCEISRLGQHPTAHRGPHRPAPRAGALGR
jgi:hypothetical protein